MAWRFRSERLVLQIPPNDLDAGAGASLVAGGGFEGLGAEALAFFRIVEQFGPGGAECFGAAPHATTLGFGEQTVNFLLRVHVRTDQNRDGVDGGFEEVVSP